MQQHRARPVQLERLEDRLAPALSLFYQAGNLTIRGVPTGQLDVTRVGALPTLFRVTDNSKFLGTFNVAGDLTLQLAHRPADIKIDLNAGRIGRNLLIQLGNGYTGPFAPDNNSVDVFDSAGAGAGRVGGSVTVLRGNTRETVNVGALRTAPFTVVPLPIRVGNDVTFAARPSAGPLPAIGDTLNIDAGTLVGRNVTAALVNNVAVGRQGVGLAVTRVGGSVTVAGGNDNSPVSAVLSGEVGRGVSFTGTNSDDNFTLQETDIGAGGIVGGNVTANLLGAGALGNTATLGAGQTVGGNAAILSTGDALDLFMLGGQVAGNLTVQMGNGENALMIDPVDPLDVGGSMTFHGGNGKNHFGNSITGAFNPTVGGDLRFFLGNGDNGTLLDPNTITASVGGTLVWRSGNGPNFVQLGDGVSTVSYRASMIFGSNDDTLIVNLNTGSLSGFLDGGFGTNELVQTSGTLEPTLILLRFA
jgi:hypothetical protein